MKCKTPTEVLLVDTIQAILDDLPGFGCDDFHHKKEDRHGFTENCPVEKRFELAVNNARKLIK